jgi:predicted DNA-binding transcriptional regulator AlpA
MTLIDSLQSTGSWPSLSRHPDDLLTTGETATVTHFSPRTLENWRRKGIGPKFVRIGGRGVRYRWGDIVEYANSRRFSSTSEEQAAK